MAGNVPFVKITYKGDSVGINAGAYKVSCVCDDNCYFTETGTNTCDAVWEINKCPLKSPVPKKKYPYTGESIEPEFKNYSPDVLVISGDISGVETGDYTVFFDILDKSNYEWDFDVMIYTKNNGKAAVGWEIVYSAVTAKIPYQSNRLVYNGENQSPVFANYDQTLMTLIGGIPLKKNAGEYWVVFRLKNNCVWSDGSTEDKRVKWEIDKKTVSYPYIKTSTAEGGMYYYEIESKRYPVWVNYIPDIMIMSGDTYDVDNSWHTTYFDFKDPANYAWADNECDTYAVQWKLSEPYDPVIVPGGGYKKVHIPRQVGFPYEDGMTKYPSWDRFDDTAIIKAGGIWEGVNADIYYVLLELRDGYAWEDDTVEIKAVPWKILAIGEPVPENPDLIIIHIPVQINIPYYDGLVKEPEWDEWDKFGIDVVKGELYGVLAGEYYLTLRPQTGYIWEDGTVEDKIITWVINPREEEISDDPVPKTPSPERDGDEGGDDNSHCCCCTPCCDTGIFNIFNCPEDDSGCDCS